MKLVLEPTSLVFIGLKLIRFFTDSSHIIIRESLLMLYYIVVVYEMFQRPYIHIILESYIFYIYINILFFFLSPFHLSVSFFSIWIFFLLKNEFYFFFFSLPKKNSVAATIRLKKHILTVSLDSDNVMRWVGY